MDVCLTDAGLILEEVTVVGGKLAPRLTAAELEIDVALDRDAFTTEGERMGPTRAAPR